MSNNNVVKSERWHMELLDKTDDDDPDISCINGLMRALNIGKTTIGRNAKADVVVCSDFSSRNHCIIELDNDSDELTLTDSSSNGTYVNDLQIVKNSVQLKTNDLIGIGCTVDSWKIDNFTNGKRQYFVFKVVDTSPRQDLGEISLLSDDDEPNDEINCEIPKHEISNGIALEAGDEVLVQCISSPVEQNRSVDVRHEESFDDSIEMIQWSQQVLMDIKEEAQPLDMSDDDASAMSIESAIDNDNDSIVYDDIETDQMDKDVSMWREKLSQDQDQIRKPHSKHEPKGTKMIDSLPQLKRRRSVSCRSPPVSVAPKRRKSISNSATAPHIKLDGFIKTKRQNQNKKDVIRAKLHELTVQKQKAAASDRDKREKTITIPKVKNSESRGGFLQEPIAKPIGRLRRKSEVDEERRQQLLQSMIGVASTSKGSPSNNELDSANIDRLDPFAKSAIQAKLRAKEASKQSNTNGAPSSSMKSIGDALANIDQVYFGPRKRIARVKSTHHVPAPPSPPSPPRPRKHGSASNSKSNAISKKKRNVTFNDECLVHIKEFVPGDFEHIPIIFNPVQLQRHDDVPVRSNFQNDPMHGIISEVTAWDVDWLDLGRDRTPPITGSQHVITQMLSKYPSYEDFQKTIIPLLKHELWASILADAEKNAQKKLDGSVRITFTDVNVEKRGTGERIICHCQIDSQCKMAIVCGDFLIVRNGANKFFAYVTDSRTIRNGYEKRFHFSMESAVMPSNDTINRNSTSVTVIRIANIRIDLKLFNAVYTLKNSPMKSYILDPSAPNPYNDMSHLLRSEWRYEGYDALNDKQKEVLRSIYGQCLSGLPVVSLVQGPPGTGKSRLIVNLLLQLIFGEEVRRELRILVCAHSNAAVDILALKLMKICGKISSIEKKNRIKMVRFGKVDSMDPDVQCISLNNLVKRMPSPELLSPQSQMLTAEKAGLMKRLDEWEKKNKANVNNVLADQMDSLRKRIKQVNESMERKRSVEEPMSSHDERKRSEALMTGANIIFTTLSSSINLKQYVNKFDICIIDEASQCIEPWSMIPLQFDIQSLIMVGDSQQLPAVVLSQIGHDNFLERSLFTRMHETCTDIDSQPNMYSLCEQYRMDPRICFWPNNYFYHGRLTSSPTTIDATFRLNPYGVYSLDYWQSCNDGNRHHNSDEAKFIIDLLKIVVRNANPEKYSYGIITPYAMQRNELQKHIGETPELASYRLPVNTIDSYQGQEKDIIILSTTRTIGVGFLNNPQRLNVALTRAKKCLLVCGNFTSIKHVRVWNSLLSDATDRKLMHDVPKRYTEIFLNRMLLKPNTSPK